jgi:kynurenine formamidase
MDVHLEVPEEFARRLASDSTGLARVALEALAGTFDPPFPNHTVMHGAGKFGLASLCNLDRLPATGAVVIAAPLKVVHGSGSPVRVMAIVPV